MNLLRFDKRKVLTFDLETCNLNLGESNYPWQVSWVISKGNNIVEEHDYYLDWGEEKLIVSEGARIATGYDYRIVKEKGSDPVKIYKLFNSYLRDEQYIINGYNLLGFDIYVERQWARYTNHKHSFEYMKRIYDSYAIAKAGKLGIKIDKENALTSQLKVLSIRAKIKCNLSLASKEAGLEVDESKLHNSLYDVTLNNQLFRKQIWQAEI